MELNLESLGITKQELIERIVDKGVEALLSRESESEGLDLADRVHRAVAEQVRTRIDRKVQEIAEETILPRAEELVQTVTLQQTNKWGETTGQPAPVGFKEYLVQRAEAYMQEQVSYNGKTKAEDSYNWSPKTTRIAFLVEQHLHYHIEAAMKEALKNANSAIVVGLEKAVKIALQKATESLKVSVGTGR